MSYKGPGSGAGLAARDRQREYSGGDSGKDTTKDDKDYSKAPSVEATDYGFGANKDNWGGYEASTGVGLGTGLHEGFASATGASYGSGGEGQKDSWSSSQASSYDYGLSKPQTGSSLSGEGLVTDVFKGVTSIFKDEDWTKAEGFAGYGLAREDYLENVPMASRSMSERLTQAPLDTIADIAGNPFVSAGLAATGFGLVGVGVKALDAVADMIQGESTTIGGVGQIASALVGGTAVGEAFGPLKGVAMAGLQDVTKLPEATAGFVGKKGGGVVAGSIAQTLSSNPYAQAAFTAAGALTGEHFAREAAKAEAQRGPAPSTVSPLARPMDGEDSDGMLLASAKKSIKQSEQLRTQAPDVTRYIEPLPMYGSSNNQLPFYGLS